jgi:hypothetical protein
MSCSVNRRQFLRGSLMAGAMTGFVSLEEQILVDSLARGEGRVVERPTPGEMPMGVLGNLKISRLISGGNLIGGWAHSRDLLYVSELMRAYNTEARQFDTFELNEEAGINTVQVDMTQVDIVNRYKQERGSKLQIITSVRPLWGLWTQPAWDQIKTDIDRVVDQGVDTVYIHGGYADRLVEAKVFQGRDENIPYIGQIIEYIKSKGVPAGLGSHALEVVKEADRAGIEPDYYFKTFHHDQYWSATPAQYRKPFTVDVERKLDPNEPHDNMYDLDPEATAAYMKTKKQPWFAFKTLAAGAIEPKSGFTYAFAGGADFIVVGMLDFQVAKDVTIFRETLASLEGRERPWCA